MAYPRKKFRLILARWLLNWRWGWSIGLCLMNTEEIIDELVAIGREIRKLKKKLDE